MKFLETRQVGKAFHQRGRGQVWAVDDVSMTISQGSLTVLTGPSGSGKTTLLSLLGALDRATKGQVLFEERDLSDCSDTQLARIRRQIGFVFQDFALLPRLSVVDCITYPLIPCGISRREREQRADTLLAELGIAPCRDAPTEQLSGGESQRVAVARALVGQPRLFLADEPTSNLDSGSTECFIAILRRLHAAGTTIVLATHDPQLLELATEIVGLQQGRLQTVLE